MAPTTGAEDASSRTVEWETQLKWENNQMAKQSMLLQTISGIRMFGGEPCELDLFIQRGDAVAALITSNNLPEVIEANLRAQLLARIDIPILVDLGVAFSDSWETVRTRLKEKYGGAKRSVSQVAARILRMKREKSETTACFSHRLGEGMRVLKGRIQDACQDSSERAWRIRIYEELAQEVLLHAAAEKVKTLVKISKPTTFEETVALVADEEEEYREAARERRDDGWVRVEKRIRPVRGPSVPRYTERKPMSGSREARPPPRQARGVTTGNGRRPQTSRRETGRIRTCWECGNEGHFARECPYIFRREQQRTYADITRGEPMEVNAGRAKVDGRRRGGETTGSESECSAASAGSAGRRRLVPRRGSGTDSDSENGGLRRRRFGRPQTKDKSE